jgi:nucleotidyltransferase substrate binding protein (TIGR01987 family)
MGRLNFAYESLISALNALEEAIDNFENFKNSKNKLAFEFMNNEALSKTFRDSLIQRFEFCSDLFWKYLKKYLDEIVKTPSEINGPGPVIRVACKAKIISELDAEVFLEMIKSRNLTSHIYKEEVADQISVSIPGYCKLMKKYTEKLIQ